MGSHKEKPMLRIAAACSCLFGFAIGLDGGEDVAQSMSTSNRMAMAPNMVHSDTESSS